MTREVFPAISLAQPGGAVVFSFFVRLYRRAAQRSTTVALETNGSKRSRRHPYRAKTAHDGKQKTLRAGPTAIQPQAVAQVDNYCLYRQHGTELMRQIRIPPSDPDIFSFSIVDEAKSLPASAFIFLLSTSLLQ
ncbi:MAG: hypothetical protein ABI284_07350 [Nitrosospira sp.]